MPWIGVHRRLGAKRSAATSGPSSDRACLRRRRPEQTSLYAVVRDNLRTLYAAVEDGFAGAALPDFARKGG